MERPLLCTLRRYYGSKRVSRSEESAKEGEEQKRDQPRLLELRRAGDAIQCQSQSVLLALSSPAIFSRVDEDRCSWFVRPLLLFSPLALSRSPQH